VAAVSPAVMMVLVHSEVFLVREKTTLGLAFNDTDPRVVGRCRQVSGQALVRDAAHDVRVRALEKVECLVVMVWATVRIAQVEAELPKLGALVGEKAFSEWLNTNAASVRRITTRWSRVV
jgi:hypothetical protein